MDEKAASTRSLRSSRQLSPSSALHLCNEEYSGSSSGSDSDLDPELASPGSYSDSETDTENDLNTLAGSPTDTGSVSEGKSEVDLDSEAEEILKNIARFKAEGPAKPNHTPHTKRLWQREGDFWNR